jgi:phosphohistidine phosphatase
MRLSRLPPLRRLNSGPSSPRPAPPFLPPTTLARQVSIAAGVFKYVLLRLSSPDAGGAAPPRSKLLVWGHPAADYHNALVQRAKAVAARAGGGLRVDVLGGGRIEHYPEEKVISVYGYSAAFGPAPHEVSAALLRRWHPHYGPDAVTVSYDGY